MGEKVHLDFLNGLF